MEAKPWNVKRRRNNNIQHLAPAFVRLVSFPTKTQKKERYWDLHDNIRVLVCTRRRSGALRRLSNPHRSQHLRHVHRRRRSRGGHPQILRLQHNFVAGLVRRGVADERGGCWRRNGSDGCRRRLNVCAGFLLADRSAAATAAAAAAAAAALKLKRRKALENGGRDLCKCMCEEFRCLRAIPECQALYTRRQPSPHDDRVAQTLPVQENN